MIVLEYRYCNVGIEIGSSIPVGSLQDGGKKQEGIIERWGGTIKEIKNKKVGSRKAVPDQ